MAETISVPGAAAWRFYPGPVVTWHATSPRLRTKMREIAAFLSGRELDVRLKEASAASGADILVRPDSDYSCVRSDVPKGVGGPGRVWIGADCRRMRATAALAHELGHALGLLHANRRCSTMNASSIENRAGTNVRPSRCARFRNWNERPYKRVDLARLRAYWSNRPPVARFTLGKTAWEVGENLRATESGDDGFLDDTRDPDWNIARETVDWGDGSELSMYMPPGRWVVVPNWASHSYDEAGTYTITLTATDSYGVTSTKQLQVTVTDPTGGSDVIWM